MRKKRRAVETLSLSFLDAVTCGFGAVILLLVITKIFEPVRLEESNDELAGLLARYEQELNEIIGAQIVRAFRYIVRHQVRLENSYLFVKPHYSVGAIRKSPIKYDVRIDYVQHTIAGMTRALDLVPK